MRWIVLISLLLSASARVLAEGREVEFDHDCIRKDMKEMRELMQKFAKEKEEQQAVQGLLKASKDGVGLAITNIAESKSDGNLRASVSHLIAHRNDPRAWPALKKFADGDKEIHLEFEVNEQIFIAGSIGYFERREMIEELADDDFRNYSLRLWIGEQEMQTALSMELKNGNRRIAAGAAGEEANEKILEIFKVHSDKAAQADWVAQNRYMVVSMLIQFRLNSDARTRATLKPPKGWRIKDGELVARVNEVLATENRLKE